MIATVRNTNATLTASLFEREWKNLSINVKITPTTIPTVSEKTTSISGSRIIDATFTLPPDASMDFAMPKETAKSTSPTASSSATTGRSVFVTGPRALYCLTTIRVAAGAVADAIAPRIIAASTGKLFGIIKYSATRAISTTTVVITACKIPIIVAFLPICLSSLSLNSLPIEKAIKPRATSEIIENSSTACIELKPSHSRPR